MTVGLKFSRREILRATGAAAAIALPSSLLFAGCDDDECTDCDPSVGPCDAPECEPAPGEEGRYFYFAMVADSHLIDQYYEEGTESNALDNESILLANERFSDTVDQIRAFREHLSFVLHGGDVIHRLPFPTLTEYFENETAIDLAAEELARFELPVYGIFGNHDYRLSMLSLEDTHDLFKSKLDMDPYTYFDHNGWRFILTNCYLGLLNDPTSEHYDDEEKYGSFGQEQLEWMRGLLQDGLPTILLFHQPPLLLAKTEPDGPLSFEGVVKEFEDTIVYGLCGHWHRWVPFKIGKVPVLAISSTRYDEDAMVVVRVDTKTSTVEIINEISKLPVPDTPRFDPTTVDWSTKG